MAKDSVDIYSVISSVEDTIAHIQKMGGAVSVSEEALIKLAKPSAPKSAPLEDFLSQQGLGGPDKEQPSAPAIQCQNLDDVVNWIGDCARCPLHQKRNKIVYGEGSPNAELMFIGEGPGADEDRTGKPFVGAAGKLLTKMIEGGLKKTREDVFIANIVKCRPPGNRDPHPDEMNACMPFLKEQVRLIQPKVICALGRISAQALLDTSTPISKLRGQWHEFMGIKVMPTFHPAALLRNPANKRPVWEDLQMIIAELGWNR